MGCKDYFEKCVGRILLYRFEREQYFEMTQMLNKGGEWEGKNMGDVYGAEHLCRLFGMSIYFPLYLVPVVPRLHLHLHVLNMNAPQSPSPNSSPKQTWTANPSVNSKTRSLD